METGPVHWLLLSGAHTDPAVCRPVLTATSLWTPQCRCIFCSSLLGVRWEPHHSDCMEHHPGLGWHLNTQVLLRDARGVLASLLHSLTIS